MLNKHCKEKDKIIICNNDFFLENLRELIEKLN